MAHIDTVKQQLTAKQKKWLISGVAGFIGSNLLEELLNLGQQVVGLDNFSTGKPENLAEVKEITGADAWSNFRFHEADIRNLDDCRRVCEGVDFVIHQAALGSVPRSIEDPIKTNQSNIDGFLNMLVAAKDAGVARFVYAASSSTYGDHPDLPKEEDRIGRPLSPYAVTKYVNELYADVFARTYGLQTIGLRYFNIFGRRQDPNGAYAAVIPKWTYAMLTGKPVIINGDGETSRDFCYINNAVQANLLAAITDNPETVNKVYNIAYGEQTSLNQLFCMIRENLLALDPALEVLGPIHGPLRAGDVTHSLANISRARMLLGYEPEYSLAEGLKEAVNWFRR